MPLYAAAKIKTTSNFFILCALHGYCGGAQGAAALRVSAVGAHLLLPSLNFITLSGTDLITEVTGETPRPCALAVFPHAFA